MTYVVSSYILLAPEGFALSKPIAYIGGAVIMICCFIAVLIYQQKLKKREIVLQQPAYIEERKNKVTK
jgi:amino acid permease